MISINKIIDGISEALNKEFGDTYEIYTEKIEQGLKEPCFSIVLLQPSINQFLGQRYYRKNLFCVYYFPASKEAKSECFDVEERLMNALEYISIDSELIRGTDMRGEMTDEVLSFMVSFNLFTKKEAIIKPSMESMRQSTGVRKENE